MNRNFQYRYYLVNFSIENIPDARQNLIQKVPILGGKKPRENLEFSHTATKEATTQHGNIINSF